MESSLLNIAKKNAPTHEWKYIGEKGGQKHRIECTKCKVSYNCDVVWNDWYEIYYIGKDLGTCEEVVMGEALE